MSRASFKSVAGVSRASLKPVAGVSRASLKPVAGVMRRRLTATLIVAATVTAAAAARAQTPGFTRTPLLDQPLSVSGRHGVALKVDIAPGAESGRHTHPGDEFEYVLEGEVRLEIDGQPAKTFKAGEVFFVPAGAVHNGHNAGATKVTLVGTMFAETGKPLTTPVK